MSFKDIYEKVEELKDYSIDELLDVLDINLIKREMDKKAIYTNHITPVIVIGYNLNYREYQCVVLHEIGHHLFNRNTALLNQRTDENNANIFMCLMLLKNDIWNCDYFDRHLIDCGVQAKVAKQFNDYVWQRKLQIKYDLVY